MSEKSGKCSTCHEVVHVTSVKSPGLKHLKLLEQAHCAHCWRPLRIAIAWPGPREAERAPYGNGLSIVVAQCGHLYHGTCSGKVTHCTVCFAKIQKLVQLHYQEGSSSLDRSQPSAKAEPKAGTKKEDLGEVVEILQQKIEKISAELVQLRGQLAASTKAPPVNRWR